MRMLDCNCLSLLAKRPTTLLSIIRIKKKAGDCHSFCRQLPQGFFLAPSHGLHRQSSGIHFYQPLVSNSFILGTHANHYFLLLRNADWWSFCETVHFFYPDMRPSSFLRAKYFGTCFPLPSFCGQRLPMTWYPHQTIENSFWDQTKRLNWIYHPQLSSRFLPLIKVHLIHRVQAILSWY